MKVTNISFGISNETTKRPKSFRNGVLAMLVAMPAVSLGYDINIDKQIQRDYFIRKNKVEECSESLLTKEVPAEEKHTYDYNGDGQIDAAEKAAYNEYEGLKSFDKNGDGVLDCSGECRTLYVCGAESYRHNGKKETIHVMREHKNNSHEIMKEDFSKILPFLTEKERTKHQKLYEFYAYMNGEIYDKSDILNEVSDEELVTYLQKKIKQNGAKELFLPTYELDIIERLFKYEKSKIPKDYKFNSPWFLRQMSQTGFFFKKPEEWLEYKDQKGKLIERAYNIRNNNESYRQKLAWQLISSPKDPMNRRIRFFVAHPTTAIMLLTPNKPLE